MSTATQVLVVPRNSVLTRARDYAELTKLRVTTLIVMTAWCGYYFGALKSGSSSLSWGLFHALLGIALISGGTAALNELMERDIDSQMRRPADHLVFNRPDSCKSGTKRSSHVRKNLFRWSPCYGIGAVRFRCAPCETSVAAQRGLFQTAGASSIASYGVLPASAVRP